MNVVSKLRSIYQFFLTRLCGFQEKHLYLVVFSLYPRRKETCNFVLIASEPCHNIDTSKVAFWRQSTDASFVTPSTAPLHSIVKKIKPKLSILGEGTYNLQCKKNPEFGVTEENTNTFGLSVNVNRDQNRYLILCFLCINHLRGKFLKETCLSARMTKKEGSHFI